MLMSDTNILKHIGFIMDGNGRWAKARGLARTQGHKEGLKALENLIKVLAEDKDLQQASFYCFSTENWARPALEVKTIMGLLKDFLETDLQELYVKNIEVKIQGDLSEKSPFDDQLRALLNKVNETKLEKPTLTVNLCINYGGRDEIIRATNVLISKNIAVTEENLNAEILGADLPLDLIVRTSGENRLSNFLLWQSAYAEFIFTNYHWPDINAEKFAEIKEDFFNRERRFGKV
jgi:undecaprenyl diphosphate synthase